MNLSPTFSHAYFVPGTHEAMANPTTEPQLYRASIDPSSPATSDIETLRNRLAAEMPHVARINARDKNPLSKRTRALSSPPTHVRAKSTQGKRKTKRPRSSSSESEAGVSVHAVSSSSDEEAAQPLPRKRDHWELMQEVWPMESRPQVYRDKDTINNLSFDNLLALTNIFSDASKQGCIQINLFPFFFFLFCLPYYKNVSRLHYI